MRVKNVKGRIFQRGTNWFIAYYAKKAGKSVEVRELGGLTQKEAIHKLKHRQKEIGASDLGLCTFTGPERVTMDELLDDLLAEYGVQEKELKKSASHMKHLRAFFGGERAVSVTSARLDRYILDRRKGHRTRQAANGTINRELHILRRAFTLAATVTPPKFPKSLIPKFPPNLTERVRQGFTNKGDLDAVLASLTDADVREYIAWAFWTGMRRSEISQLTWTAFDRETWMLALPGRITKNGKPRKLALEGIYRDILKRRLSARRLDCPLIFHRNGMPMGDFRKAWARACKTAGVAGLLFHDLRRTAVRNMVRAGVDTKVVKAISGHKTDAVFERYNITDDEDLRAAALKTEEYVSALSVKSVTPRKILTHTHGQNTDRT